MSQNSLFFVCAKSKAICGNTVTQAAFPSICIQPRCLYSLPSSVKLRHLCSNREKKMCVWSIGGICKSSLPAREVQRQDCNPWWATALRCFLQSCLFPRALPGACAFKPLPVDFTRAHFLPVLKALPHHICEGLVLEQAKQSRFPPPRSANNKRDLPPIPRIKWGTEQFNTFPDSSSASMTPLETGHRISEF